MALSHLSFRRRMRPLAVAAAVALSATFAVACGSNDEKSASSPTDGPATLAPSSAIGYAEVLVRPSGDVAAGVETAARRMLRVNDAGGELRRLLDEQLDDSDRGVFSRDVDPFLGDTIGGFLLIENARQAENPDGAVIISVRDRDAAQRFLEQQEARGDLGQRSSYAGVDYWTDARDGSAGGLVGDFLVAGTDVGFRAAVDASRGGSLADESRFSDAVGALPDDRLAWAYAEPRAIVELLREQAASDPQLGAQLSDQLQQQQAQIERAIGNEPITAALTARADQVVVDFTSGSAELPAAGGDGAVALGSLPGAAWAALSTPPLGDTLISTLRESGQYDEVARMLRAATALDVERDVFGWLGGIGAFVSGTSPLDLGAGIVIGSTDAAASQRFVARLEQFAGNAGLPTTPTTGAGRGFQIKIPDLPQPIAVIAQDDKVVIGLGVSSTRDAVKPSETLGDTEPGKSAIASLGDGFEPAFVLVPGPLLTLVGALGLDRDPEFQSALPYLTAYRSIVAGSRSADGKTTGRLVLNLQDPDETP
jgi:hypothetical protein